MAAYSQVTLPPLWSVDGADDLDPGGNCSAARCVPQAATALTVLSSLGSIIGSLLIIGTFLRWKDLRTIARMILVFLAISDLLAAIGYVFGASIYIHYYYITGYCHYEANATNPANITSYQHLCTAQSFLTTLMPMASFLWTANLALYLFFSILWPKMNFARSLMILFHITAWGIPLVTCIAVVSEGYFGSSESRSSGGWCWIKYNPSKPIKYFMTELMAGKFWEIAVCVLALFVCIVIKIVMWRRFRKSKGVAKVKTEYSSISIEKQMHAAYTKLDQKLIWLPVVFLLLRIWGNIRFFISLGCDSNHSERCCNALYNPFIVYMQSICDPGQGWSNALLFVIFNEKILHRLCPCLQPCWTACCYKVRRYLLNSRRPTVDKKRRVIKHVNIVAVREPSGKDALDGGGTNSERRPLLDTSLQTSSVLESSVLYHSTPVTTRRDEDRDNTASKPVRPSINSEDRDNTASKPVRPSINSNY